MVKKFRKSKPNSSQYQLKQKQLNGDELETNGKKKIMKHLYIKVDIKLRHLYRGNLRINEVT